MTDTQTHPERLPVTLLAGFLGSGKTTLANRILSEQHNQRIAVIVNEFGDVGIDGSLVVGVKDNIVELNNGCICCTVRNDLAETLRDLMERREQFARTEPFERVLIEASGMASPGPAVQTLLMDRKLSTQFRLDGVITMAHAQHIVAQLQEHPEASEQVGYADRIILNHCDQSTPEALEAAASALRACNREASIGNLPGPMWMSRHCSAPVPGSQKRGNCRPQNRLANRTATTRITTTIVTAPYTPAVWAP
jgi:G3E family GTPase